MEVGEEIHRIDLSTYLTCCHGKAAVRGQIQILTQSVGMDLVR